MEVPGDRYMAQTNSRKGGAMYLSPGTSKNKKNVKINKIIPAKRLGLLFGI
jgi:hypothetical protein